MREITLLRHGATTLPGRYLGQADVPLSATGLAAMHAALGDEAFDAIVSSPLQRCAAFAQEFSARHALPCTLDADWMELGFGAWDGQSAQEIMQHSPEALQNFWRDPIRHPPPGGEALPEATQRILAGWHRLADMPRTLIVTHGGVMRLLFCQLMQLPLERLWSIEINHVARMRFVVDEGGVRLRYFHAGVC